MTKTRRTFAKNSKENDAKTPAKVGVVAENKSERLPQDLILLKDQ